MAVATSDEVRSVAPRGGRPVAVALLATVGAVLALAAATPAVAAPGACELSLQAATTLFQEGRFTAAREAVNECITNTPNRAERKQSFALLAQIYLVLDNLPSADNAVSRLLDTDPEYEPDLFASLRFRRLVDAAKARRTTPVVTSVSKAKESLAEAPATVVVITGDEIERRGYTDLMALIYDLSGFDVARRAGTLYTNVYQRGYRSLETNRTLLLVDGVEQNDLYGGALFLSRQFPLSNIERIEVIHGPASTMYGANAFAGVVNIITKEPEGYLASGQRVGYDARAMAGSFNSWYADATVAGQSESGRFAWSLTARKMEMDEFEWLGDEDPWDYEPEDWFWWGMGDSDYLGVPNLNPSGSALAGVFEQFTPAQVDASPYFDVEYDASNQPVAIHLTEAGAARARELDHQAYDNDLHGNPVEFGSPVDDWYVYGKLRSSNLVFGYQMWRTLEGGSVPLTDFLALSGNNGFTTAPEFTALYMKYNQRYLEDKLTFTLFTQYKRHEMTGNDSRQVFISNYAVGDSFAGFGPGVAELMREEAWLGGTTYMSQSDNQLRVEANAFYDHSEKFNILTGVELRYSSVGADLVLSREPFPAESGSGLAIGGGNTIASRDVGFYTQASYRPWQPLKLVAGIRFDNNEIRDTGGYGTVFNPRLAAVYTWRDFVFKAVYAEAFQDAPNFQKFGTLPGQCDLDNPGLAPEEVANIELSAAWSPNEDLTLQVVGFSANYEGIVDQVEVPCPPDVCEGTTGQFQNVGTLEIKGVQAEAQWTPGAYRLGANYTFTDPFNPDYQSIGNEEPGARIGEIASHRFNLLASALYFGHLEPSLRLNWVMDRETGPGTTVDLSPYSEIDDYFLVNGAVTYRDILPGLDLQLAVENIADTEWYSPGIRNYPPFIVAPQVTQPGRAYFLRLRVAR